MTDELASRGLKRLLAHCLLAGAVAGPASAIPFADEDRETDVDTTAGELDDDLVEDAVESLVATEPARAGQQLACLLEAAHPFDATRIAALAALSAHVDVRLALAEALASRFRIVGGTLVLEQLGTDAEPRVREAAARAADARGAVVTSPVRG